MSTDPPNQWRYYELNDVTRTLLPLAHCASMVENIKRHMGAQWPVGNDDRYQWMPDDFTMQWIADCIYTDKADLIVAFARAAQSFSVGFADQSLVDQGRIYAIWACDYLFENGYDRNEVDQRRIVGTAKKLWKNTLARQPNSTADEIPNVRWSDICNDLGLADLPRVPVGRPGARRRRTRKPEERDLKWVFRKFLDKDGIPIRKKTPGKT